MAGFQDLSPKADVWSAGLTLAQLIGNRQGLVGTTLQSYEEAFGVSLNELKEELDKALRGEPSQVLYSQCAFIDDFKLERDEMDFLKKMLQPDPRARGFASELLNDPFLKKNFDSNFQDFKKLARETGRNVTDEQLRQEADEALIYRFDRENDQPLNSIDKMHFGEQDDVCNPDFWHE